MADDMPPLVHETPEADPAHTVAVAPGGALVPGALELLDNNGDVRSLEDIEAEVIRFAITHYRGQMSEVARRLRIGRSTLYRKLEVLDLDADAGTEPASGPVAAG
jgi:DNA-binding NtrC family response regulator